MARSTDLDKVAPDDQIIMPPKVGTDLVKEIKIKKEKKVTKTFDDLKDKVYDILGHTKSPFSSLLVNPHVFDFEERDSEEKIVLVARPHWFTNVSWIMTVILLVLAPSLLSFVPMIGTIPAKLQTFGVIAWYLVAFAFAFEKFLSWYFDVFIITDERVIDIDFNNLLDKKFSEAKISAIQDVSSRVSGVGQTMFNFGTVYIQTASEVPNITFEMVPNPEKIIKVLQILREKEEIK